MSKAILSTSRSLPIALLRARERVVAPIRTILANADVTEQQWRVLRVVQESGPMEPTKIAEEACLLLPSLTRILQKLEEKKLIHRKKDRADRRRQIVKIAAKGNALIEAHITQTIEVLERVSAQMGRERYDTLLDLLNELDGTKER